MMSSRQRVRMALNMREPDRVPIDLGGTGVSTLRAGVYTRLRSYLGLPDRPTSGMGPSRKVRIHDDVLELLKVDTRAVYARSPHNSREARYTGGRYVNEWGIEFQLTASEDYAYVSSLAPLASATVADLSHYEWPDPVDPGRIQGVRDEAKQLHELDRWAVIGNIEKPSTFELALALRGFERLLEDMAADPAFANRLLDIVNEIQILRYEQFLQEAGPYLDVIFFGDDLGMQTSLLISPRMYRDMIKPRHKALFEAIRRRTDAKILYHTCGAMSSLIPDFIDIGVDCLNPVQVAATGMDSAMLKREFGKHMSFWGAIDTQHVLPFGTPDDVRKEVRLRIADLSGGGGYVVAPVHNVQDEVPPENVVAMVEETLHAGDRLLAETH